MANGVSGSSFLYPNVSSVPGPGTAELAPEKYKGKTGEFDQIFTKAIEKSGKPDLTQVKAPLKFSTHAAQRLQDRKIKLDAMMMNKVNDAVDKAEAKGVEDTLVLTPDAALIVSVKNRTVITALVRSSLGGNVFTNIDGAVIV